MDSEGKCGTIYISGGNSLFDSSLSYVLEHEVGAQCVMLENGMALSHEKLFTAGNRVLLLIDTRERDFEADMVSFKINEYLQNGGFSIALLNVHRGIRIESRAFLRGIKGFFYRNDTTTQLVKGVRALFNGEVWITRDLLVQAALQTREADVRFVRESARLTPRETEILSLLSVGASNDEIGDRLFISPNTVKTHLYRIYKKIKVPNRFQAALWVAKNQ
jgi:DNA-binding NarL/FixJ family response regulator